MNGPEILIVRHKIARIEESFTMEVDSSDRIMLRPREHVRKKLGLSEDSSFYALTLDSALGFVGGFLTALTFIEFRKQGFKTRTRPKAKPKTAGGKKTR